MSPNHCLTEKKGVEEKPPTPWGGFRGQNIRPPSFLVTVVPNEPLKQKINFSKQIPRDPIFMT